MFNPRAIVLFMYFTYESLATCIIAYIFFSFVYDFFSIQLFPLLGIRNLVCNPLYISFIDYAFGVIPKKSTSPLS